MSDEPDDVTVLRILVDRVTKSPDDLFSRRVVRELTEAASRVADLASIAQAAQFDHARRAQATVERLAVSVWGVREAHDLARVLLAEYDIYPKLA